MRFAPWIVEIRANPPRRDEGASKMGHPQGVLLEAWATRLT